MLGLNTATSIMVAVILAWLLKSLGVPHANLLHWSLVGNYHAFFMGGVLLLHLHQFHLITITITHNNKQTKPKLIKPVRKF